MAVEQRRHVIYSRRMKQVLFLASMLLALSALSEEKSVAPVRPSADQILQDVLAMMPQKPVFIGAKLQTKSGASSSRKTFNVEVWLVLGDKPPTAHYVIRDAFGSSLEQVKISRKPGKTPQYKYLKGDPPQSATMPDPSTAIQDTSIRWCDLMLSFLWWRNASVVGSEEVKGFRCHILKVDPPRDAAPGLKSMKLWITEKHRMLLRAEEYDPKGKATRRLSIKSFKKIDEEWMIKDIVVESFPSRRKTYLRVHEMQDMSEQSDDQR